MVCEARLDSGGTGERRWEALGKEHERAQVSHRKTARQKLEEQYLEDSRRPIYRLWMRKSSGTSIQVRQGFKQKKKASNTKEHTIQETRLSKIKGDRLKTDNNAENFQNNFNKFIITTQMLHIRKYAVCMMV